ncbi:gamma-glutamyl-gamma-aminobutyrate hydrolase family protein [Parvibacter caecicola]|uniref:Putative glutamine amidotransferase n=1 Tax=Parvibacter caecicola TaxID=747645 RepID=A0A7W5GPP3_9ACTN|nr:gamma-glutamyl-gamma-aminobutyrate hydrolase family protein [Parvibacter caecicola]MBB3171377.1 putative glutamine amidotransferase [Parvibacter caecicola]MCR2041254.1 gamma-glutamyl-gamma-aminobutyrate hydrolase family protein [Parvibacter caecicola]RNL11564.1 peptidase C26 [Parvibacter caecicola]
MERQPVIGLTCTLDEAQGHERVNCEYIDRIAAAGGTPILLSPVAGGREANEAMAQHYLQLIDGLLLTGGGDIHPRHYPTHDTSSEALALVDLVDENRDWLELELARNARTSGTPTLGICRGCQIINVAAGGTMHADLLTDGLAEASHRQEPPYTACTHVVRYDAETHIALNCRRCSACTTPQQKNAAPAAAADAAPCSEPASTLCRSCAVATTNSMHHQCLATLGEGLAPVAWSEAITEGIYDPEHPFYLGVQWHPEYLDSQSAIFAAFVEACRS